MQLEVSTTDAITFTMEGDTEQFKRIAHTHLMEAMMLFADKNREYGDGYSDDLGSRGQFVDINRKIGKIRTAIWDGHPEKLTTEPVEEVLMDLIAHCLLTLDVLEREKNASNLVNNPSFNSSVISWPKEPEMFCEFIQGDISELTIEQRQNRMCRKAAGHTGEKHQSLISEWE